MAPRPSISNFIWVSSFDTICQLNQLFSMLSKILNRDIWHHCISTFFETSKSLSDYGDSCFSLEDEDEDEDEEVKDQDEDEDEGK